MINFSNKTITFPPISGQTMPNVVKTNTYINQGDMLDCKFVTDKFNYYRTDKKIDLRFINAAPNEYVNLGDWVDAMEINHVINDMP
jgi:hypothetical protein